MGASFTPVGPLPIIATMEDEDATGIITVSENSGGSIDHISIGMDIPDWLTVTIAGSSVELKTHFVDSPFPYAVHSVEQDTSNTHTENSIFDVPCDQFTYKYERLSPGTIFFNVIVNVAGQERPDQGAMMQPFTASGQFVIEIYANYSIGKNALEELIKCQQ